MNPLYSIVMPNWNGEAFIARGISSLLLSARSFGRPFEFVIVDDCSSDGAPRLIAKNFPDIRLIQNKKNRGFGYSVNRAVAACRAPLVILANNDLVVKEDFCRRLMEPLEHDENQEIFGVSAKTVNWTDASPNHLNMTARFEDGLIELDFEDSARIRPTLFLQGGACSLRRDVFTRLGGFCSIFKPGYWEDYDMSWRAARMGYRLLYEPRALAWHLGKGSLMKVLGPEGLHTVSMRNYFLFTWMNLRDRGFMASHFLRLPLRLFRELVSGKNLRLCRGFARALPLFFRVLKERRKRREISKISDRKLLTNPQ